MTMKPKQKKMVFKSDLKLNTYHYHFVYINSVITVDAVVCFLVSLLNFVWSTNDFLRQTPQPLWNTDRTKISNVMDIFTDIFLTFSHLFSFVDVLLFL